VSGVDCNNPRITRDCGHVTLTGRLIENDIRVPASALDTAPGVDISDLPWAGAAPE
jgi:hypothetical protein